MVKDLAEGLNGVDGIEMSVLACQDKGRGAIEKINGIRVCRASSLGMLLRMPISLDFFRLYGKLAKESDLIIIHHPFPLGFLAYALFTKKKLAIWYHSDIIRQKLTGFLLEPLINYVLKKAQHVFVSNSTIISHSKFLKPLAYKCKILPYGIRIPEYEATPAVRERSELVRNDHGAPLILSVGRLVYYKGFEYLIEAMKSVDAKLLIIGNGPLKESLERQIRDGGLSSRVSIIPPVKDLKPYYYACDLFVLPSVAESEMFGLVQIEAMACGKPVVNTSLRSGVPEVSLDGITGLTVEPKNPGQLSEAINKILGDEGLRRGFSEAALARVRDHFDRDKFLQENRRLFLEIGS